MAGGRYRQVLNKDYYFLLPENSTDPEPACLFRVSALESGLSLASGRTTVAGDLDVTFPIEKNRLAREENIEWQGTATAFADIRCNQPYRYWLLDDTAGPELTHRALNQLFPYLQQSAHEDVLCVNVHNPLVYSRVAQPMAWFRRLQQSLRGRSVRQYRRRLIKAGYTDCRVYPLIVQEGVCDEVVFRSRYVSTENTFGLKERLKERLLGQAGLGRLASAYCIVASKNTPRTNVEALVETACRQIPECESVKQKMTIHKFISLLLPRKVILTVGDPQQPKFVIVASRWRLVAERRDREAAVLQEMHDQGLGKAIRFPRFYGSGHWQGMRYHVQEAIEGITIDSDLPEIDRVTAEAVEVLTRLRRETRQSVVIDDHTYASVAGWIFNEGYTKLGEAKDLIALVRRIETGVRQLMNGKSIDLARMHGDYKIENVLVNRQTATIEGIIDWEHSRALGLPALDLWYLFTYNRYLRSHKGIYDIMLETCFADPLSDAENLALQRLDADLAYAPPVAFMMRCLFIVHHVFCRMTHDFDRPEIRASVTRVLTRVAAELEQVCSTAGPGAEAV